LITVIIFDKKLGQSYTINGRLLKTKKHSPRAFFL